MREKDFRSAIDESAYVCLLREADTARLYRLTEQNRRYLRRWLPWLYEVHSREDTARFIRSSLEQFRQENGFQAGIWQGEELVGVIGYHGVDWVNRSTMIGYWIDESHQGQGLVTRACSILVDWAFREWRLNRVEIRCAVENQRSRAIPERLGFSLEGIAREAQWLFDHFTDLALYSLLAREWEKKRSQP